MPLDKLDSSAHRGGWQAYCNSKLANALFSFELAGRLKDENVTANCLHPGVVRTRFSKTGGALASTLFMMVYPVMISPEKGALTSIYLASSPEVEGITGKYFRRNKVSFSSRLSRDKELVRCLWEVSERLTGVSEE